MPTSAHRSSCKMQQSHREVHLISGLVKCLEAEEGGGWLIERGLLHGNVSMMRFLAERQAVQLSVSARLSHAQDL